MKRLNQKQEFQIVDVKQMDNELIQYDERIDCIYVDYKLSVMEHLEKFIRHQKLKIKNDLGTSMFRWSRI